VCGVVAAAAEEVYLIDNTRGGRKCSCAGGAVRDVERVRESSEIWPMSLYIYIYIYVRMGWRVEPR